jgi:hypothetical protein
MKLRFYPALCALVAPLLAACLESGITPAPPIQIMLDFCSDETPIWFAHRNQTGVWTVVDPDPQGTFEFIADPQVGVAFVRQDGASYRTEVIFTTNRDLEALSGTECLEETGTKEVNGTVAGLTGSQLSQVGMAVSTAYLTSDQTSFTLLNVPNRPVDFVASRIDVVDAIQHANKVILRRTSNPISGSTLSAANFDTEGFVPTTNSASVNGIGANDFAYLVNNFFSQLGTSHVLSAVDAIDNESVPFVSVPAAQTTTGDYHELFVVSADPNASVRGAERFFRNPINQTIGLGPALAEPFVSEIITTPNVLLRVQVPGQVDYSTVITSEFEQETAFGSIVVSMSVTASYFGGTPLEWNIPMPNFNGLAGWDNSWALKGGAIDWTITAFFGRPALLFGAAPTDGEAVLFASRSNTIGSAQAFRAGGSKSPLRRPPLRRRR